MNKELYNLSRNPTSFEGLDARTGHDAGFHQVFMAEDAAKSDEILERSIRVKNPALYKVLKAELMKQKPAKK